MPDAQNHLCAWHAKKAMREALQKWTTHRKKEVIELIDHVVLAHTYEKYDEATEKLYDQEDLPDYDVYFNKNWHHCKYDWSQYQCKGYPTFQARTTNYLESMHQKLKNRGVSGNTKTFCHLLHTIHNMTEENAAREKQSYNSLKTSYNIIPDNHFTSSMYEIATKECIATMLVQYELAIERGQELRCTALDGEMHTVT